MKLVYSDIFHEAWKSIRDDLALTAGLTLVAMMGLAVCGKIPFIGTIFSLPMMAGYLRCLLQIRKKEVIGFQDFFWGFTNFNRFLHLIILNLLVTFGTVAGMILLLVPGIWWVVASGLSTQIFVLRGSDSIESIKTSMALVKGRWWNICGFGFWCLILVGAGFACLLLGALVTIPVAALGGLIATERLLVELPPVVVAPLPPPESTGPSTSTSVPQ